MAVTELFARNRKSIDTMRQVAAVSVKSSPSTASMLFGGGSSGFGSPFDSTPSRIGNATDQLRAFRDVPFASIRPVAVKVASLNIRAGWKDSRPTLDRNSPRFKAMGESMVRAFEQIERAKWSQRCDARERSDWWQKQMEVTPQHIKAMSKQVRIAEEHPLIELIENPNGYLSGWDLKYLTAASLMLTGQALWYVEKVQPGDDTDRQFRIWFIPISWAKPKSKDGKPIGEWIIRPPGSSKPLPPVPHEEMVHILLPSVENPFLPHSWAQAIARSIDTDDRIQQANATSMQNVINPQVILTAGRLPSPTGVGQGDRPTLTPEQRRDLIGAIKHAYAGAERYGEPAIIDGLIENITPFRSSPNELDYLNSSEATKRRIMEGFGVSPIVAGQSQNANRAGSTVAHQIFTEITVNPIAAKIGWSIQQAMRRTFPSSQLLLAWLEMATVNDEEMILRRMGMARNVLTRGELREYASTGEVNLDKRPDDGELLVPVQKESREDDGKKPGKAN